MRIIIFLLVPGLFFSACASGKLMLNSSAENIQQKPVEVPLYSLFAVGDAGKDNLQSRVVIEKLAAITDSNHQPGTVIFLGDNIYPAGLPPEEKVKANQDGRNLLLSQIERLSNYKGKIIFIPGNHDWSGFAKDGLDAVRREGEFLNQLDTGRIRSLPEHGCGGPVPVELNDNLVILIIDSQWWIKDWTNDTMMNKYCVIDSKEKFINSFREQVAKYKDKQIIVAMHHPFYTQGSHGGHYSWKAHIFPLTALVKWLYLPLPIIGSIYPYYRSVVGHPEDVKSPRYHSLRDSILTDLDYSGEMIFLAGHEHCLQYIKMDHGHFLVSGSGSNLTAITNTKNLIYGHRAAGFMELDFYKNKSVWLSVYEVDPKKNKMINIFSQAIIKTWPN